MGAPVASLRLLLIYAAKTKQTYLVQGRNSSAWTVTLILTCIWLAWTETSRWFTGTTTQTFSVEKGVSHEMQINLDVIVAMRCADLHVNMQDAAGDRTLAGDLLRKDPTSWAQWTGKNAEKGVHELNQEGIGQEWEMDDLEVHNHLNKKQKKKFAKTPRIRGATDSCRIFGSLDGNKVQGDFHITARGHGYMEFGEHLEHGCKLPSLTHCQRVTDPNPPQHSTSPTSFAKCPLAPTSPP